MGYKGVCTMISLRARRVPWALMNFSLCSHCVLTASLLLKRRLMALLLGMCKRNTFPWRSRICHGIRWTSQRVTTAFVSFSSQFVFCIFVESRAISAIMPPWCDRGFMLFGCHFDRIIHILYAEN